MLAIWVKVRVVLIQIHVSALSINKIHLIPIKITEDANCSNPNRQVHLIPNPNRRVPVFCIFVCMKMLVLAMWVRVSVVFNSNSCFNNFKSYDTSYAHITKDSNCPNNNRQVHFSPNPI